MRKGATVAVFCSLLSSGAMADDLSRAAKDWEQGRDVSAIEIWKLQAAKMDADALYNLGQASRLGRGTDKDIKAAFAYYRAAAETGHMKANEVLGLLLYSDPVTQNEALTFLKVAASKGAYRASYVLAVRELSKPEAEQNLTAAEEWFNAAVKGGIVAAAEPLAAIKSRQAALPIEPKEILPAVIASKTDIKIAPSNSLWSVSLGTYRSNAIASVKWTRISARQRLANFGSRIAPQNGRYELLFGNFGSSDQAKLICDKLAKDKTDCTVVQL